MHKKIIALAIAACASGSASAQSNVTLYGVLDLAYLYSSGNGANGGQNTFSGISGVGAGSRLGFRGEEALGNGLKAVFTLEYGLDPDINCGVGTCGLNARQQFVGLAGGFGTVALGRQYAPGFNATARNDALDASDMSIQSSLSALNGYTITPNSPARFNNAVTYTSPNWSGLQVSAIYGFGETGSEGVNRGIYNSNTVSPDDNSKWGIGVNYANGPLNLDLLFQQRISVTEFSPLGVKLPGFGGNISEWYAGGSWDFQVVKLFASYQALNNDNDVRVTGGLDRSNLWTLGVSAPLGRGTLGLSYGRLTADYQSGVSDGVSWGAGTMYTYPLSKRTSLYGAYSYFNNNSTVFVPGQVIAVPGVVGAAGENNYAIGAGITHSF
ncbi:porin [Accumulibacter sp.]|uniref:porin n=1 Tax=Accumulibacter sp. TaxID=2053492 RepID=UPI0025E4CC6B|nr:porin [Accumulibacter sp.]MCM8595400.1 porin [Accumulibacter sp.]MCM8626419.1 porin [Accumulibacter sp.]MDS4049547.1 porin [Accumulibacter sp.]